MKVTLDIPDETFASLRRSPDEFGAEMRLAAAVTTADPIAANRRCRENPLEPRLLAQYRAATPEEKLIVVAQLNSVLLGLKAAQLATSQPAKTAAQRQAELRRWWFAAHD